MFYILFGIVLVTSIPLAFDLLHVFFTWIPRLPVKQVGYWFFSNMIILMFLAVYAWAIYFFPFHISTAKPGLHGIVFHIVLCSSVSFRILYHLISSHIISSHYTQSIPTTLTTWKTCDYCCRSVPIGTDHCHTCNACVIRADHHCPFVANCVGYKNQRHFLSFVFFLWTGNLYSVFMTWRPFYVCWFQNSVLEPCNFIMDLRTMFIVTTWSIVPITWLLVWQIFVCYTGTTTKKIIRCLRKLENGETWQGKIREWWANGSMRNIQAVVGEGTGYLDWFFFPWFSPHPKVRY
eukprot:TRINITY_DN5787_c0_g1_i5.p1 TRINITY_DN5787_c0_g1~~TRINITY_DN5787_c0_g1_i5.p1  ORF type:complete len:291 (-),score=19.93 TRINITY_DN5787_c0_g1_i5:135-1007(-)